MILELQKMTRNLKWVIEKDVDVSKLDLPHLSCRMDLGMMQFPSIATQFNDYHQYPRPFLRLVVVVPVGLGRPRHFYGIVGEFSATLWCATGGAVAGVAAALASPWRRAGGEVGPDLSCGT